MATAWVIKGPGQLSLEAFPERPIGDEEVLVRILATGVCGTDRHLFQGHGSFTFPLIAGHEIVGEIVEVGKAAADKVICAGGPLTEGKRVVVVPSSAPCGRCFYCLNYPHRTTLCRNRWVYGFRRCDESPHLFGGFSQFLRVQPRSFLFVVPEELDTDIASLTEPTAVALRAVERALSPGLPVIGEGLGVGRTGLVIGAGPIGLLTTAVLRTVGVHRILVADVRSERLALAMRMGATATIDVSQGQELAVDQVRAQTNGEGADIVWECAGMPEAFSLALQSVCRGGTVIEVGHFTDSGATSVRPHLICHKDIEIRGVWAYPWWQFRDALRFLTICRLPLSSLISHRLTLNDLPAALKGGLSGEPIKSLVFPNGALQ